MDLPVQLIARFDRLKREWGLRGRGPVLIRLLEELLSEEINNEGLVNEFEGIQTKHDEAKASQEFKNSDKPTYNEDKALVLIGKSNLKQVSIEENRRQTDSEEKYMNSKKYTKGIDLPGFVRNRTEKLKESLYSKKKLILDEPIVSTVSENQLNTALKSAIDHWLSLYGHPPNENVLEASMIWLGRDIWSNIEGTEGCSFTWSVANRLMRNYCPSWSSQPPSFERVLVLAGVLEDPFGIANLPERMPTLIRRFVNRFKKSQNVTSFQTLESTMTVHGALKLLDLPTQAGKALTLSKIRDSYKQKALELHPDAGGSTESMRRLNEGYQLLKELYRQSGN